MSAFSQNSVYYSLEKALQNPQNVKILIYNLNFDDTDTLPSTVFKLENLEELIFLPNFIKKHNGGEVIYEEFEVGNGNMIKLPQARPKLRFLSLCDELCGLKNLKRFILSQNILANIPKRIYKLNKLEELYLDFTDIDLKVEWKNLKKIPNLKRLSIIGCKIDTKILDKINKRWDKIEIITSPNSEEISFKDREVWFELQLHDKFHVFYKDDKLSEYFFNSLPEDYKTALNLK